MCSTSVCVQLSFIPPDGKFKLMSYRANDCGNNLPIYVKPSITFSETSGHVDVMVGPKGNFSKGDTRRERERESKRESKTAERQSS